MLSLRAVLPRYRPSLEQVMIIPHYRGLFLCAHKQLRFMAVYNKLEKMEGECMEKRLEDRSLEELWQLFPIFLVPHKKEWADWYKEEKGRLEVLLGAGRIKRVSHIGSTAVSGIWAKNIIDILLEVPDKKRMAEVREILKNNGWLCMNTSKNRISMNKGYTEKGFAEKVYHLHIRLPCDHDELYFLSYLQAHPAVAKEYETLKLHLWKRYPHDRDRYTEAKTDFVRTYTERAKREYGNRWEW